MKEEIRLVRPEELKQAAALADRTFRDAEHTSMGEAFPLIFAPEVIESYGVFDGERLVAFMGLVPLTMHIGAATLKTYSLGSVCTDKEYRGRGLAGKLLERVIRHAEEAGSSLLFVSGGLNLYRRANCHPYAQIQVWMMTDGHEGGLPREGGSLLVRREATVEDGAAMYRMAAAKPNRFAATEEEWGALLTARAYASIRKQSHRTWVAQRAGEAIAFAVIGVSDHPERGGEGMLIEWGGEEEAVADLLAAMFAHYNLPALRLEMNVMERLAAVLAQRLGGGEVKPSGNTLKLLHPPRLIADLAPYFEALDPSVAQTLRVTDPDGTGQAELSVAGTSLKLAPEALVRLLFDPLYAIAENSGGEAAAALSKLLPVPLPHLTGLLYI